MERQRGTVSLCPLHRDARDAPSTPSVTEGHWGTVSVEHLEGRATVAIVRIVDGCCEEENHFEIDFYT